MGFDATTTPAVGDSTKRSEYVRLRDALRALQAGDVHDFGGSLSAFISDTAYVDLPDSWECEIPGAELSGRAVYLEVNAMARKADLSAWGVTTVTASFQLWNISTGALVASSEVNLVISAADTRVRTMSSTFTLAASTDRYKVQIKTSDAAKLVSGRARVVIR
jgi:hypothetical protein